MADEIRTLLDSYHATTLWEMANAAGLRVTGPQGKKLPKSELISRMQAEFFAEERIRDSLEQLDERERAVLDRLLLRDGKSAAKSLRREVVRAGLATMAPKNGGRGYSRVPYAEGYAGHPRRENSRVFEDVVARLTYRGLVFSLEESRSRGTTPSKFQYHPGGTLHIPHIVRQYLPQPEPIPPRVPDWQPTQVQGGDTALLLRDLYLYWDYVRHNRVSLLKNGLVGLRSLRAINQTLILPDPLLANAKREDETGRLHLLRLFLEKLNLVHRKEGQLHAAPEEPGEVASFWTWSLHKQLATCLDAWSRLGPTEPWAKEATHHSFRLRHARQRLRATLQTQPAGAWQEMEDILEMIQDEDAEFLFPDRLNLESHRSGWYFGYQGTAYYGSTHELMQKLDGFEKEFIESALTGVLHQLGLVDLGHHLGRWQAFRLTQAGKQILSPADSPSPASLPEEGSGRLILQPNFQVMAIGPVPLGWLAHLDLFADRERADRGAFEYHVSRESIYRAQQLGMEIAQVLDFLEQTTSAELPQNVRRSLEEWGAQHERIVFRTGVRLLQTADSELLTRLMDESELGQHLARKVAPQVALLKSGNEEALITQLVDQGLLPAISGAEPEAADASVIVKEDGTIHPIYAVPSLHLRSRLSKLAEETPEGTWKLSPKSVRRAAGSKTKVSRLLDDLARLHRGALPRGITRQIKIWGGYYGDAAVETLSLIEFRDPGALDELQKHPDLQHLLTPFPAGHRALATVPTDRLAEVRESLFRLGVQVRDGLRTGKESK